MELLQKILAIDINYILIVLMVIFYSLEHLLGTEFKYNKRPQHLFHNLLLYVMFFTGNLLWATVTVFTIGWLNKNHIVFFYLIQLPLWVKLMLGVVMFDFVSYWFHRMAHITPVIWRFHRVHHSDTTMDASTNFRAHPLEILFWFGSSNILAAAIFGGLVL